MSVQDLATALNALIAHPEIDANLKDGFITTNDSSSEQWRRQLEEMDGMASAELIDSKGGCHWAAHRELATLGFKVVAGEKDSFGWLTGVIITPKGKFVYG